MITASLPGSGEWGTQCGAGAFEQDATARENGVAIAVAARKVEASRRAMLLYPQQLLNPWDDVTVELSVSGCPQAVFATSVVRN